MAQRSTVGRSRPDQAQAAAGEAARHPWVRALARLGLAAIGTVYILVGGLALQLAIGSGGRGEAAPDQQSALQRIAEAPLGRLILGLVAAGLFGYLAWRLMEAFADLEGEGNEPRGLGKRAGHALSGLIYGGLGLQAARMALGLSQLDQGSGPAAWTARFMSLPLGRWLVGLAGLGVIGYGLFEVYKAWKRRYRDDMAYERIGADERRWIDPLSMAGLVAHGVVLGLIGSFLVRAAYTFDPQQAQGLSGALSELASHPAGPWLLGLTALGLAGYGVYKLAEARYHRLLA